jgi:hypothetical protein
MKPIQTRELLRRIRIGQAIDIQLHRDKYNYLYEIYRYAMKKYSIKTESQARECHNLFLSYSLGLKDEVEI